MIFSETFLKRCVDRLVSGPYMPPHRTERRFNGSLSPVANIDGQHLLRPEDRGGLVVRHLCLV